MSEAPERIFVTSNLIAYEEEFRPLRSTEYVRADRIEELEAKLAKAEVLQEAQKLFNLYAVQVLMLGATVSRLENLESAWINLKTQAELTGGKDEDEI